jgi:hypothetical protein
LTGSLADKKAVAASDWKKDDDAVAATKSLYCGADFLDHSHKLVTDDQRLCLWEEAIAEMQV